MQNKNKPKVNDVAEKFWKTVRRFTVLFIWTHRIQRCNPLTLPPFGRRPFSNVHTVHNGWFGIASDSFLPCVQTRDSGAQDLLETNIRQRGDVGGSAKKVGLRIKELERLYGIQNGATSFQGNQHNEVVPKNSEAPTQVDLASQMGISVDTLNNYKRLTEMIPELEDLVDTGIVTKSTALAMIG